MKKYIVFDIGGTKVKYGLINENGIFIEKHSYDTNCIEYDFFILEMLAVINHYKNSHNISGIGISIPGFVNVESGFLEKAGAIISLDGKNLKKIIENSVDLPVEIENDANCVALAEKINGNAENCKDYICYTIGTGIGGGIVINDKIVHGHKFMGGEFGFMKISDDAEDCLHLNSSMGGLIQMYKKLKKIENTALVEGMQIFAESKTDSEVKSLLDKWYKNIAISIFNLTVTLNPEKVLIGGGVSESKELLANILTNLNSFKFWKDFNTKIEICKHTNNAGMIGALYNFRNRNRENLEVK